MEQPSSHLRIKREGPVSVVEFADRKILEELSIQEIQEELKRVVDEEPGIKLLLDFANVDHLASAALGTLITLHKKVKASSGALVMCKIRPEIYEVFAITRLNRLFDIKDDENEAMVAFQG